MKTLFDLILADFHGAGNAGKLTRMFIDQWHLANPLYGAGKWPLGTLFASGCATAGRPLTRLDRATAAWRAAGHGAPLGAKFDKFLDSYEDEFDLSYYDVPVKKSAAVKKPKKG